MIHQVRYHNAHLAFEGKETPRIVVVEERRNEFG